jgi:RHS repeat-associated protein
LLAARSLPSPRTHWRKHRRLRRRASGRSLAYNLRFPGQYYQAETGLNQNYFRDYDPAVGRYVESDPIGLAAGVNTYAYVRDNPVSYNDPTGLDGNSTIQCDGNGDYEVVNKDKNECTAACTKAHEQSHIADWKKRYGADSCRNKPRGFRPGGGYGYLQFLWQSECSAYGVQGTCLRKLLNDCKCKADAQAALPATDRNIYYYCNTVPVSPDGG